MPELPEAETIVRDLQRRVVGSTIRRLASVDERIERGPELRAVAVVFLQDLVLRTRVRLDLWRRLITDPIAAGSGAARAAVGRISAAGY